MTISYLYVDVLKQGYMPKGGFQRRCCKESRSDSDATQVQLLKLLYLIVML